MTKKRPHVTPIVADEVVDTNGDTVRPPREPYPIRLRTLENIHSEMNRVYRDARQGRISSTEGNKLVWSLGQIKVVVEAINNTEQAERLLEIETRLGLAKALGGNVRQLPVAAPAPNGEERTA